VLSEDALSHPEAGRLHSALLEWSRSKDDRLGTECIAIAKGLFGQLETSDAVPADREAGLWALATATEFAFPQGDIWRGTAEGVAQHALSGATDVAGGEEPEGYVLRSVQTALGDWSLRLPRGH
jgi:hypothetical protein